jgi:hypothetical protein
MSLTELALLDGRRPLPLWDVMGLLKKNRLKVTVLKCCGCCVFSRFIVEAQNELGTEDC